VEIGHTAFIRWVAEGKPRRQFTVIFRIRAAIGKTRAVRHSATAVVCGSATLLPRRLAYEVKITLFKNPIVSSFIILLRVTLG